MQKNKTSLEMAKEVHKEMIDFRRDFHMHPEIGFDVHRTAGIVAQELEKYGLKVKRNIGKTGVIADLDIPGAKKRIALRADMDALPLQELNEVSYKSIVPMRAHMCGHDAHTAMLLGAAKQLAGIKHELKTNVRFVFQPCEEALPGGAPAMIKDGALDGVDEIYALHVWPTLPVGRYGICLGDAMAQPDGFDITIIGRGGHAAAPHSAIDPIVIAAEIIQALQTVVSRNVPPEDCAVLTFTQVHAGASYNIIPEACILAGTVRTYKKNIQQLIRKRVEEIVTGIAKAHGATVQLKYTEGFPAVYNREAEAKKIRTIASTLVEEHNVDFPAAKVMFGEDFSYFLQDAKGCYIHLGIRNEAKGITQMLHDPRFDIDEDCLIYGAAMHLEIIRNET